MTLYVPGHLFVFCELTYRLVCLLGIPCFMFTSAAVAWCICKRGLFQHQVASCQDHYPIGFYCWCFFVFFSGFHLLAKEVSIRFYNLTWVINKTTNALLAKWTEGDQVDRQEKWGVGPLQLHLSMKYRHLTSVHHFMMLKSFCGSFFLVVVFLYHVV